MTGWIARKLRAGRYSMNLQLLEADLKGSSAQHRAAVIVVAAAMIEKVQADDLMTGMLLSRAVLEPFGTTAEAAQDFYNALEDVLTSGEEQRKHMVKHTTERLGASAAQEIDYRARIQQQGIRLLLVALARKVDDDFKAKARRLKETLFEAKSEIKVAVATLHSEDNLLSDINSDARPRDFAALETLASLFAFAFLGW